MTRFFISLYLVVLAATATFLFGINPFINWSIQGLVAKNEYENFRGTIRLLDNYLLAHPSLDPRNTDTHAQAESHKALSALFGYNVTLLTQSQASLSEQQRAMLDKHGVVSKNIDEAEFLFSYARNQNDLLWRIQEEPTLSEVNHNIAIGTINLIHQQLAAFPAQQWPQRLAELQPDFSIPLKFIERDDDTLSSLPQDKQDQLNKHRVVTIARNDFEETFYYWSQKNQWVLVAQPVQHHIIIQTLLPIISVLLAILIGIAVYLWVAPVWAQLRKLQTACVSFGNGDFSTRVSLGQLSPLAKVAHTFNAMTSRVESLIASHKDLTNAVSHELRTPLARMRFSLAMLDDPSNTDTQNKYLAELALDVNALDTLVAELLTYARFEREQPELTLASTAVEPWLATQLQRSQSLTSRIQLSYQTQGISSTTKVNVDARLLSRAVSNLLQNAIKYANKKAVLSATLTDSYFVITVDDDGIGIPEDKRKDIFSPFSRVDDSRTRDTGGFGIGLAIVEQIASWHRGDVSVSDSALGGSRFTIRLPRSPA